MKIFLIWELFKVFLSKKCILKLKYESLLTIVKSFKFFIIWEVLDLFNVVNTLVEPYKLEIGLK